jgi:hypothetical protein
MTRVVLLSHLDDIKRSAHEAETGATDASRQECIDGRRICGGH